MFSKNPDVFFFFIVFPANRLPAELTFVLFSIWLLWWLRHASVLSSLSTVATLQRNLSDVEDVKFVINFDYPNNSEDYIHRIGRTARSQKTGTAYTFFTHNNVRQAGDLVSVLREANQAINPKLLQMVEDRGGESLLRQSLLLLQPQLTRCCCCFLNLRSLQRRLRPAGPILQRP